MIKYIIIFLIIFLNFKSSFSRNAGETEITTENGIEVFQNEKYYLLKKNVQISSDELTLNGQNVKIFFDKDLYDIKELVAKEDVSFESNEYNISGRGSEVKFNIINQEITVYGKSSELFLEDTKMLSNEEIYINNIKGSFFIKGLNSKLISDNIFINGSKITGTFEIINEKRNISELVVEDDEKLNIKTDDLTMFSKKAKYDKRKSVIELFEEVQINRGNEIITGDYGILDTKKNSYKVSSKNSNKVKAIIVGTNE
tara:strand:+ start:153 stop:920 length:768 start_codon:yes stop_codon:yes gene_type:complete